MSKTKDWRDNYAEVECWVWANYRHKIVVKVPENSTPQVEALKVLKSEPLDFWCDPHSEDLDNFPDICERYEVGNDLEILEAFCEDTTEQQIIECCWNVVDKDVGTISHLTGARESAIVYFIDNNKLNKKRIVKDLVTKKLNPIAFVKAISGEKNNPTMKEIIKIYKNN